LKGVQKKIPIKPGVYFFKDKNKKILYIGKAKNLNRRVNSYFSRNQTIKTKIMLSKSNSVDYLIVSNEVEALITEANMIKEYKPKYNICLKDDKTFPYIVITKDSYPKVEIIRKKNLENDGNVYFGPYTDVKYLRTVIKALHKIFPIRACNNVKKNKSERYNNSSCFCGFCVYPEAISKSDYEYIIKQIIDFLKGKNKKVRLNIKNTMDLLRDNLEFEKASKYRDQLLAIDSFIKKQKKITYDFKNYDIVHAVSKEKNSLGVVIRVRNGFLIGLESFNIYKNEDSFDKLINGFLIQYYNRTHDIPDEVLIGANLKHKNILSEWLSSKNLRKVKLVYPKIGNKKKMLELCIKNASMILKDRIIKNNERKDYTPKTLKELQKVLLMDRIPKRIEAFDNSNIQGKSAVSGMVCYINGKPLKKDYRRFNIKSVKGIDDFKSIKEVVYRRYLKQLRQNLKLPDLILIDGGKGQVSSAKEALDKLKLNHIPVVGLAKKFEEVYLPESKNPLSIPKDSPALYLLMNIRNEVHRYAINFHRKKRNKSMYKSSLKEIHGLGEKRYKLLLKKYKTISAILKRSAKEISLETKIPISVCARIIKKLKIK
tara:strand:+ start:545 stop:2338 length:1794 start_codon:yes stop_codon:yes gene_type:complete